RASATGAGAFAFGLSNAASDGEVLDVTARAQGESYAAAIRNEAGAPVLRTVRAIAAGANISEGIVNGGGAAALLQDVTLEVTGGADFATGVRNEFASARVLGGAITVTADGDAFGVTSSFSGTPSIDNTTVRVTGGSAVGVQADDTQTT